MNKNIYLIAGILTLLVFIGYLSESEPHAIFGININIWIIRMAWLSMSISNFLNYYRLRKAKAA